MMVILYPPHKRFFFSHLQKDSERSLPPAFSGLSKLARSSEFEERLIILMGLGIASHAVFGGDIFQKSVSFEMTEPRKPGLTLTEGGD
jgi:hypothetical protein